MSIEARFKFVRLSLVHKLGRLRNLLRNIAEWFGNNSFLRPSVAHIPFQAPKLPKQYEKGVNELVLKQKLPHPLFVFSIDGPKQNATSLLTPFSNIVFNALSSGTLGLVALLTIF